MQCPLGDGELIAHTTIGEKNITISYSTCPACHGHWMEPFAANFIKLPPDESDPQEPIPSVRPVCPVCTKPLTRTTGDNIPDTVTVYSCGEGHGYFFPAGQLAAFKKAQKTKIEYHRLWNLPLPSVASVLLAGLLILVLTGGLIAGFLAVQNRQTTTSQARELLTSVNAYESPQTHDVLIHAKTSYETTLTIHIPSVNNFEKVMNSTDLLTHTIIIKNIPPGTYDYYFTMEFLGEAIQSKTYTFSMP